MVAVGKKKNGNAPKSNPPRNNKPKRDNGPKGGSKKGGSKKRRRGGVKKTRSNAHSKNRNRKKNRLRRKNHKDHVKNKRKQGGGKRKKGQGKKKRIKDVIAQRAYDMFLKKMYVPPESTVSTYEMSNVIRERVKRTVRFDTEMPALFSRVLISAQGIDGSVADDISVDRYVAGPFGARLVVSNKGNRDVYLNKDGAAIFNINGGILAGKERTMEVTLPNKEFRTGTGSLELGGRWVQSKAQAEALGTWVLKHQFDGGEVYTLDIFGNPLIDVGDIIFIEYADYGITDYMRFIVSAITHDYSDGLSTEIVVRRIYPDAAQSAVHKMGVSQNPILL